MFSRLTAWAIALVVSVGISSFAAIAWLQASVNKPLAVNAPGLIDIPEGSNLNRFAQSLQSLGLISGTLPLRLYARLYGKQTVIAGEYGLYENDTLLKLLDRINSGDVVTYKVVFPEGTTYRDWLTILASTDKLISTAPIDLKSVGIDVENPEGWFFPDTYFFHKGDKDIDILSRAYRKTRSILEEEWPKRADNLPLETPYQALILASIIEKETAVPEERGKIAGVFTRRLQQGIKLQTDPTVIYGLGDAYKGKIGRRHLRQETPYNTYLISGLPPTPIAMPGRESIVAALHPEPGDSLFFVAKGDGSHFFSATVAEHNEAVKAYQLQRRSDYRSTPQPQDNQTQSH